VDFMTGVSSVHSSTGVLKKSLKHTTAYKQDGTSSNIGLTPYTVIMWCPVLTSRYGSGATGMMASTVKLGGLSIQLATSSNVNYVDFDDF
jgi:hypothetical protein